MREFGHNQEDIETMARTVRKLFYGRPIKINHTFKDIGTNKSTTKEKY